MTTFLEAIHERVVIFDGGMGTCIQTSGVTAYDFGGPDLEGCNELRVVTRPDVIADVHARYLEVGCDVIETDTLSIFSASKSKPR